VQALQTCLTQLAPTDWDRVAAGPALSVAEAVAGQAGSSFPILAETEHKAGFYRTFQDFRNNTPVQTPALVVSTKPNTQRGWEGSESYAPFLQRPDGSAGEALRGAWGFSDGKQLFIYHRNGYYLLVPQGNDFRFLGPSAPDPQAMTTGAILGGVAGGLIAASSTSNKPVDYGLDLRTGRIAQLGQATATPLPAEQPTHVFVYRPRSAKGPVARVRLGADQPVRELAVGDYLELLPLPGQPLQISLLPDAGPEISLAVTPTSETATYFECRPAEAEPLRQVKSASGAAAVSRLAD
jgi:hypothetical protein